MQIAFQSWAKANMRLQPQLTKSRVSSKVLGFFFFFFFLSLCYSTECFIAGLQENPPKLSVGCRNDFVLQVSSHWNRRWICSLVNLCYLYAYWIEWPIKTNNTTDKQYRQFLSNWMTCPPSVCVKSAFGFHNWDFSQGPSQGIYILHSSWEEREKNQDLESFWK